MRIQKFGILGLALLATTGCSGGCSKEPANPPPPNVRERFIDLEVGKKLVTLEQNWSDDEARYFYNTPQGSRLFPYDWFLNIEQPDNQQLFTEAGHIRELGYIPRVADDVGNPDGLPVGMVRDFAYPDGKNSLGVTCAACHTNQINFGNSAILIDGGSTIGDGSKLLRRLESALRATLEDSSKFDRFAERLELTTESDLSKLRESMQRVLEIREGYNARNFPNAGEPQFGHGRIDAFGAILNESTVRFLGIEENHAPANAPVSYPFIWDAPQHDKVQWNGAAENFKVPVVGKKVFGTEKVGALTRNCGEVLGVFGVSYPEEEIGFLDGYASTVNRQNLIDLEELLTKLWSPEWPEETLGEIDREKAAAGREIYKARCALCHDQDFERTDANRSIKAKMVAVGTDQTMARNVATRRARTGPLQGRSKLLFAVQGIFGDEALSREILGHFVIRSLVGPEADQQTLSAEEKRELNLSYLVHAEIETERGVIAGQFNSIVDAGDVVKLSALPDDIHFTPKDQLADSETDWRLREDNGKFVFEDIDTAATISEFNALSISPLSAEDSPLIDEGLGTLPVFRTSPSQIRYQYKARPLNGIWATAPFLHNGSVPNLRELLLPADQRQKVFRVGDLEYDPENVGYRSDIGPFEYDVELPGNSNLGHEYGSDLDSEDRDRLLEYLKTL